VISASTPKLRRRVIDDLEGDSAPMNEKSSPEELIKYRRYALKEVLSFPAILIRQRRTIAVAIGRLKEDLRGSSRSQAEAKKVSVSGHAASFAPQEADGLL
jgi:hypothetical protein